MASTTCECGAAIDLPVGVVVTSWECGDCGRLRFLNEGRWVPANEVSAGLLDDGLEPRTRFLDDDDDIVLDGCLVIGGCGYPIAVGSAARLCFGADGGVVMIGDGFDELTIPPHAVLGVDIGGPGAVTTGGGFGYFFNDFNSFAGGLLTSTVLNLLTTRTKIHTILRIETEVGEVFVHYGAEEPAALRITLSRVFTGLRLARR